MDDRYDEMLDPHAHPKESDHSDVKEDPDLHDIMEYVGEMAADGRFSEIEGKSPHCGRKLTCWPKNLFVCFVACTMSRQG